MTTTPDEPLEDKDMVTTGPEGGTVPTSQDADGTDGGDADGTDGDGTDGDGTDGTDGDSTDGDGTDGTAS